MIDWPNSKAFAYDNVNMAKMAKLVFDRQENIVGNREILVSSIFSFSYVFKSLLSQGH